MPVCPWTVQVTDTGRCSCLSFFAVSWSQKMTDALLDLYEQYSEVLDIPEQKKWKVWEVMVKELPFACTWQQAKSRMNTLKRTWQNLRKPAGTGRPERDRQTNRQTDRSKNGQFLQRSTFSHSPFTLH